MPLSRAAALAAVLLLAGPALAQEQGTVLVLPKPVVVHALAVAEAPGGFVGSVSTISIIAAPDGTGHVFVDTSPLAQVDMQGSARLAVRVASAVSGIPLHDRDVFFVVRSDAPVIGGPSAGGIMTVGTIAALQGWPVNASVAMTGTINPDGDIGPIGGLLEKIEAAAGAGITTFLFPEGQENVSRLTTGVRTAPASVADHCARLGIRCVAVAQVEDAVRWFTGHQFAPRPTSGNVTSEGFLAAMRPLAASLTAQARALVVDTSNHFDRASRLVPSSLRGDLQQLLNEATRASVQGDSAFADGRYYTASSRSYQASVNARYVDHALSLFEAQDGDGYVRAIVEDVQARASHALNRTRQPVQGVAHLEGLGAAQERATEAEQAAARALAGYRQGNALDALQAAAQARERSESVGWWLDLAIRATQPGQPLDEAELNRTARDLLDIAREALVYARVLLQEAGGDPQVLSAPGGPQQLVERAERDLARGLLPAAIFESIEGEVRASVALELAGASDMVIESKLARARERAASAIVQARADGLEPLLAQSYFEFARDVPAPEDSLAFYNTARSVALLGHSFFGQAAGPRESRFVGDAPIPQPSVRGLLASPGGLALLALAALVGALVGAAVALGLAMARRPPPAPPREPPPPAAAPEAPGPDPFVAPPLPEEPRPPPPTPPPPHARLPWDPPLR